MAINVAHAVAVERATVAYENGRAACLEILEDQLDAADERLERLNNSAQERYEGCVANSPDNHNDQDD